MDNISVKYRLVCPIGFSYDGFFKFNIYDSEKQSWDKTELKVGRGMLMRGGICIKGVAYWKCLMHYGEDIRARVLCLDLKKVKSRILKLPSGCISTAMLCEINGRLGFVYAHEKAEGNSYVIELYIMRGSSGFEPEKLIEIDIGRGGDLIGLCRAITMVSQDVVLILLGNCICSYNAKFRKLEVLDRGLFNNFKAYYVPYINSMVSLPRLDA